MQKIIKPSLVKTTCLLRPTLLPTKNLCRSLSTNQQKTRTYIPYKTISASIALTSSLYLYSCNTVQAESVTNSPSTSFKAPSPGATVFELHDTKNDIAMKSKTTQELAIALFVYRICSFSWLVDAAPFIIAASEKYHLDAPFYWFLRHTFFSHFCGGETSDECISSMDRLAHSDINCILDLSVEADLRVNNECSDGIYHHDDKNSDKILSLIKNCIHTAAQGEKFNAMVAIKVTAFSSPELLLRLNQALFTINQSFLKYQKNGRIDADGLSELVKDTLPAAKDENQERKRQSIIENLQREKGALDFLEFKKLFNFYGPGHEIWWDTNQMDPSVVLLTNEDLDAYDRMMDRMDQIGSLAYKLKVGIMIDAEQSYFQEAIDHVAVNLQRKYNSRAENEKKAPTIFNTYQMYTKTSREKLELDVELSNRENFVFAAKLVRGAYMVSERKRALDMKYPSPIHETLQDTHDSYNSGVRFLLSKLHEHAESSQEQLFITNSPIVFMVASHNRESVILTIEEMEKKQISPHSSVVLFGQLFSMQDQLSYTLARHGYSSFKYLPHGTIEEVIPYLLRRAQENSAILGGDGVFQERNLIWNELKARITGKVSGTGKNVTSA